MSQAIYSSINPNTTSGTQLATLLNDLKNAIVSGFSGTSRPPNLQAYGYWIDTTDVLSGILYYKLYDGSSDITVFTVNTDNQTISFAGVEGEFGVTKISDDEFGPKLKMQKERITGAGQTLEDDILGDIEFLGVDASEVSYVQARIRVITTDNVTSAARGSLMTIFVTPDGGNALAAVLTLSGDKRIGVGIEAPEKTIHAYGNDDSAGIQVTNQEDDINAPQLILQKKRIASLGQVLSGDIIGQHIFRSVDDAGTEIEVAKIEVEATENHSTTDQGVKLTIFAKQTGGNTLVEALKIEEGALTIFGQQFTQSQITSNLLDGTNDLLSIDGAVYGAFEATYFLNGRNAGETRQQKLIINGVYDYTNTTWKISESIDTMEGATKVIELSYTNAAVLEVEYINQIGTFLDGKIYSSIKRNLR